MSEWLDLSPEEYRAKLRERKERQIRWLQHEIANPDWRCPKCGARGTVSLSGSPLCGGCGELVSTIKLDTEPLP